MLSNKMINRLANAEIYVIEDIERTDGESQATIEYGDNEDYISYNGTDEDFIDALEDTVNDDAYFGNTEELREHVELLR